MAQMWFVASALLVGMALFGRPTRLSEPGSSTHPGPRQASRVRIVVPARDEAASLAHLLSDLAADRPTGCDVVVVDDRSSDGTGDIARSFRFVTVLRPDAPPPGWQGKPWACAVGAGTVDGLAEPDELVFLDADVRVGPGAIDEVLALRAHRGGVVSVQPFHRAPTVTEQLSALFNVVSMMGIDASSEAPTGMFGPVVACTTTDYRHVGGHASVRNAVTEDVALAQRFIADDTTVSVFAGADRISFRMYPKGLASLIEGWTKNMAIGAGSIPIRRSLGVAWWITGLVSAAGIAVQIATGGATTVGLVLYALTACSLWRLFRRVGDFRWWVAALFPVPLAFFVMVFLRSVWRTHVRRSVTWRGRAIDLRDRDAVPDPSFDPR
jgi:4,4'-diaponeurosporenoate glycosyltransferase